MLNNLFLPLWEVSINPASDPILDNFLGKHMSGFDCVDNEANPDPPFDDTPPSEWKVKENPPYSYWMYYLWANITVLNMYRAQHHRSTFDYRPHCGEAGATEHLGSCFLLANAINHGINANKNPAVPATLTHYLTSHVLHNNSHHQLLHQHHAHPPTMYYPVGQGLGTRIGQCTVSLLLCSKRQVIQTAADTVDSHNWPYPRCRNHLNHHTHTTHAR